MQKRLLRGTRSPSSLRRRFSWRRRSATTTTRARTSRPTRRTDQKDGTKVGQQLIDDRIVAAIDTELGAKGLTKATANPDVFVIYHVAFDKQKDISTYSSGYGGGYGPTAMGWGGGWAGGTTTTQVRDILIGTMVIDVADAKQE